MPDRSEPSESSAPARSRGSRLAPTLLLLLLATAGCARGDRASTQPAAGAPTTASSPGGARRQDLAAGSVAWTPVPDPIPLNELFGLEVVVAPDDGAATVTVDAGMPGHGHGMTVRPKTARRADGVFEARGLLFHMPGEWEIVIDVERGGAKETARFTVTVP